MVLREVILAAVSAVRGGCFAFEVMMAEVHAFFTLGSGFDVDEFLEFAVRVKEREIPKAKIF